MHLSYTGIFDKKFCCDELLLDNFTSSDDEIEACRYSH